MANRSSRSGGGLDIGVAVVGAGHVGLVTAACFAKVGHRVSCIDNDAAKIEGLKQSPPNVLIHEPGLEELVRETAADGRLRFTDNIPEGIAEATIVFLCVGTPQRVSGEANLYFVEKVAGEIAECLESYKVLVEKSTVPVKTGERVRRTVERVLQRRGKSDIPFDVVSNPEFLAEGTAVRDFMCPHRIVLGVESQQAGETMRRLYQPIAQREFDWPDKPVEPAPIIVTHVKNAELIKHVANSFLSLKISFINAVANVCERAGADVEEVAYGIGLDPRIGPAFLRAGVGYGGYCFPKDVAAFYSIAKELGYDFELLRCVMDVNAGQRKLVIERITNALWNLRDKTIAVLGLSFKPNTDDMRGAPALDIIPALQSEGALIRAYDPAAMTGAKRLLPDVVLCSSPLECADNADLLLLLTEWEEFRDLANDDLLTIRSRMRLPIVVDARNVFSPARMRKMGFEYHSIGRP